MNNNNFHRLKSCSLEEVRSSIRNGQYAGHTAGLAPGYLQANIIIVDKKYALDFMRYCQRNPKPCPLVGVSDTGQPIMSTLGASLGMLRLSPSS